MSVVHFNTLFLWNELEAAILKNNERCQMDTHSYPCDPHSYPCDSHRLQGGNILHDIYPDGGFAWREKIVFFTAWCVLFRCHAYLWKWYFHQLLGSDSI